MTTIRVTPMAPEHYGVEVEEGHVRTGHEVVVDGAFVDELGLTAAEPTLVAEEVVNFLLERQPAVAIPRAVSVRELDDVHPEFREELHARVTARLAPDGS